MLTTLSRDCSDPGFFFMPELSIVFPELPYPYVPSLYPICPEQGESLNY